MAEDAVNQTIKVVLKRRRSRIDPQRLGFPQPTGKGRRAGGRGLTQPQVDKILNRALGTYQRLESGRYPKPPEGLLKDVATLLGLSEDEWVYLWRATWRRDPPYMLHMASEQVPGSWRRILATSPHIAYCTNHRWDILGYNSALIRALPGGAVPRNSVEWTLLHPDARVTLGDWANSWAREVAPLLGAARAAYRHDAVLADLERRVLRDKKAGPIYKEFGEVKAHTDGAVRPFVHAQLGPGWVNVCSSTPRAAPTCQIMYMIFDVGVQPPASPPPMPAIPA